MPFDALPDKPDAVLTILTKARELGSEPNKWCKGALLAGEAACALGLIGKAARGTHTWGISHRIWRDPTIHRAIHALASTAPQPGATGDETRTVASYNNASTTTHADLLAWFDRAITARVAELTTVT